MARNEGIYKRPDSGNWWICATLPNGKRVRQSAGTDIKEDAAAYLAKLRLDAYRETHFGIKPISLALAGSKAALSYIKPSIIFDG